MAELDVQPKRNSWWPWLLLILLALAALFFLTKGCNNKAGTPAGDSTAVAATDPDWNGVDFNAPKSSYEEVTDPDISVTGNDRYTIYTLGENILFPSGENTLQGSAEAKLEQIAASLEKRFKGAFIGVYGSTDSTGTAGQNQQLGGARADAVKTWLVEKGKVSADHVSTHSFGETQPVSTNATAQGRQENRNVRIVAFTSAEH